MGTGLNTILVGTILQLTGTMENAGKRVAIGRRSEPTTDLTAVDCNVKRMRLLVCSVCVCFVWHINLLRRK